MTQQILAPITHSILHLHGGPRSPPPSKPSTFVGFLFPGEIAVLLGDLLSYQGRNFEGGYRKFLVFNVIGGALWATTFVLLGLRGAWLGRGWRRSLARPV